MKESPKAMDKTDNQLIAEFMGWEKDSQGFWNGCEHGVHYKLTFDSSWNELMPVVNKIRNKYQLWCQTKRFKEMDPIFRKLQNELIFCSIQGTHEWCVEFIKWYNSQNNGQ